MKVNNKVIVVTGVGNGMGRELVLSLIKKGAKVAAVDINESALLGTLNLVDAAQRDNLSIHVLNITDKDKVLVLPQQIIEIHGSIDGLINDAGIIQPFVRINDLDFDNINRVFNINFFGTLFMIKAFLPYLLKSEVAHLINVSSMGGFLPVPGQSIYGASKAAVKLLTEGLSAELINTNVKVSVVFPGAIGTNIMVNSGLENSKTAEADAKSSKLKPLSPDKAAQIIIKGIEKDKVRIFVGSDSKMLDILYRLNPKFATGLIAKQMQSLLS